MTAKPLDMPAATTAPVPLVDYFIEQDGTVFAGRHLLIDIWQAQGLIDVAHIETALRNAAAACGATVLDVKLHQFTASGGISGVAILAESHMSIHTWPERDFAAVDIFMCGGCDPYDAVPILKDAFASQSVTVNEMRRGLAR